MKMFAAILLAIVGFVLMWFAFKGLYWICKDRERERHEQRHHEDNDMPRGGEL